jgi:hypothetical protein
MVTKSRTTKSGINRNGLVLWESATQVAIATGFKRASANRKTGKMIQIFIIVKHVNPVEAIYTGQDEAVCFQCPLRGHINEQGKLVERACYVDLPKSVLAVWNCFQRGGYRTLSDYSVFDGRVVRFGAYGEPVLLPFDMVREIARRAKRHTGYTHRWKEVAIQGYRQFFMASCNEQDYQEAESLGWRAFVVSENALEKHVLCPASDEALAKHGKKTDCEHCGLCAGNSRPARSVWIPAHGAGKKYAYKLAA